MGLKPSPNIRYYTAEVAGIIYVGNRSTILQRQEALNRGALYTPVKIWTQSSRFGFIWGYPLSPFWFREVTWYRRRILIGY